MPVRSVKAGLKALWVPTPPPGRAMKELLRTNDPVLLSWAEAVLAGAGIGTVLLDMHTSILEGSISAIPRRIMVDDTDYPSARRLLTEADPTLFHD
jgi:hypothetical protein